MAHGAVVAATAAVATARVGVLGADAAVRVAVWPLHPLTSKAHDADHQAGGVAAKVGGMAWEASPGGATRRGSRATRLLCMHEGWRAASQGRGRSCSDLLTRRTPPDR